MIKFPTILEDDAKKIRQNVPTKYILSEGLDGAELIPIDLGGRLITPQVSINELGKLLLKAAAEGNGVEIKLLLAKGAPFTADWLGTSPLHVAAQNNHLEICEILLRAGISKDARTKVDRTPLHMAAYEGHVDVVETLLKHGADYDCRDLLSMTPLHWAVQNGHIEVVEAIIKKGAELQPINKFNLTPSDIAFQNNRNDIVDLINNGATDSSIAAQNLMLQLASESVENSNSDHALPLETILMENEESSDGLQQTGFVVEDHSDNEQNGEVVEDVTQNEDHNFTASMKILQEHGITMLPNDESENNILSTVMESGHSVVLTDVGKEVLDSVKQSELQVNNKKIIALTADEFLAMTTNGSFSKNNIIKQVKVLPTKTIKRIVMHKSRIAPVTSTLNVPIIPKDKKNGCTDMEVVMTQLIEARKTIEDYKLKLLKKEQEAERYKQQLRLLMDSNS